MSANNQERFNKKCVLCEVNNAQVFDLFCEPCFITDNALARLYMAEHREDAPEDAQRGNLRRFPAIEDDGDDDAQRGIDAGAWR